MDFCRDLTRIRREAEAFRNEFYKDFYKDCYKDSIRFFRNVKRAPPYGFILGLIEDRCKDSKGIDGILKDLYKDASWISRGLP